MSILDQAALQDETAYLERRRTYIGSADAAPILGFSEFNDRRDVWRQKVRPGAETLALRADDPGSVADIERGRRMEPVAFEVLTRGLPYLDPIAPDALEGQFTMHPEHEFVGGTPDAEDRSRAYEIKCSRASTVERILKEGLPGYWVVQCQHHALLTGKPVTLALLDYDRWTLVPFEIEPDPAFQAWMVEEYAAFWEAVLAGTDPDPLTPYEKKIGVCNLDALDNLAVRHYHARAARKRADAETKALKAQILTLLGEETEALTTRAKISADYRRGRGGIHRVVTTRLSS